VPNNHGEDVIVVAVDINTHVGEVIKYYLLQTIMNFAKYALAAALCAASSTAFM